MGSTTYPTQRFQMKLITDDGEVSPMRRMPKTFDSETDIVRGVAVARVPPTQGEDGWQTVDVGSAPGEFHAGCFPRSGYRRMTEGEA